MRLGTTLWITSECNTEERYSVTAIKHRDGVLGILIPSTLVAKPL